MSAVAGMQSTVVFLLLLGLPHVFSVGQSSRPNRIGGGGGGGSSFSSAGSSSNSSSSSSQINSSTGAWIQEGAATSGASQQEGGSTDAAAAGSVAVPAPVVSPAGPARTDGADVSLTASVPLSHGEPGRRRVDGAPVGRNGSGMDLDLSARSSPAASLLGPGAVQAVPVPTALAAKRTDGPVAGQLPAAEQDCQRIGDERAAPANTTSRRVHEFLSRSPRAHAGHLELDGRGPGHGAGQAFRSHDQVSWHRARQRTRAGDALGADALVFWEQGVETSVLQRDTPTISSLEAHAVMAESMLCIFGFFVCFHIILNKKGGVTSLADGLKAVRALDNGNIYGVIISEAVSNAFKEGMWFKALVPYMLIVTNNDPVQVGSMLTVNGLTRAFVGVVIAPKSVNYFGLWTMWVVTGFIGLVSILVNTFCLMKSSVGAAYVLSCVWAVYNAIWNSCLETTWMRSIIPSKRKDVNDIRQITNKLSKSFGPLFSASMFLFAGNSWDINLVQNVMLFGTAMTVIAVLVCFCFRASEEVEQDHTFKELDCIIFPSEDSGHHKFQCSDLVKSSFDIDDKGLLVLKFPIGHDNEDGLVAAGVVKQFRGTFHEVPPDEKSCVLCFQAGPPRRVLLKSAEVVFLDEKNLPVDCGTSQLRVQIDPRLSEEPPHVSMGHILTKLIVGKGSAAQRSWEEHVKRHPAALLSNDTAVDGKSESPKEEKKEKKVQLEIEGVNTFGAKIIVACDLLHAVANGMSLKFLTLFLKVEYGVMPACIFLQGFIKNMISATFTPYVKELLKTTKEKGYRTKLGVVFIWCMSLVFSAILCLPGMPLFVVLSAIVMLQALNGCTRSYNRALLANYIPRDEVANYMAWDSVAKAVVGAVGFVGGELIQTVGYRGCFFVTWLVLLARMLLYLTFTLSEGPDDPEQDREAERARGRQP